MSIRASRRQSQQVFRIGIIAGIVGILLVFGGFIIYFLIDQGSRQVPLDIPVYPGAQGGNITASTGFSRNLVYRIPNATPEEVAAYYQQKLREFTGSNEDDCVRNPANGNFLDYDPARADVVPYEFTCLFDRSYWNASQYTRIRIQPGVRNEDPALNTEGMTIVEYYQQWNP
jgi:hypothetical protein